MLSKTSSKFGILDGGHRIHAVCCPANHPQTLTLVRACGAGGAAVASVAVLRAREVDKWGAGKQYEALCCSVGANCRSDVVQLHATRYLYKIPVVVTRGL
jgi:hypothetical protein